MSDFKIFENGSVTEPKGFRASGVKAGLKRSGNTDMALVCSDHPCSFAAAFTSCTFAAAPVQVSRRRADSGQALRAVIINSGNANACTGKTGLANAETMCECVADMLDIPADEVMVASTGRIGVQLPMEKIKDGIALACELLDPDAGVNAAKAIMTTDTVPKHLAVELELNGVPVRIGAMTKGVGMIDPKLNTVPHATMICIVTTDAEISGALLTRITREAVGRSFNRITVDGDMSTNDTVIVMANGAAGVRVEDGSSAEDDFADALEAVMRELARKMVLDGEGATKFVEIRVNNARDEETARLCAEAVANSLLCKTAWFGCDPNWGRIVAALGYSGADFDPDNVNIYYNDTAVVSQGGDAGTKEEDLAMILRGNEFTITVELNNGDAEYWVWTSDISYEYVKINAEYHT